MKYNLLFIFACLLASLQAQQPVLATKGASPLAAGQTAASMGSTYALVVGISDYQDPGIPDLRFADKDAEAFAAYLRSQAGGGLDADHLKVLINREATAAQFGMSLDWLLETAKQDDRVIIYFSGHGDVEKKTLTQPGFLLCWDAPARVYLAGGAFALPMLQEVISTLSVQNQAKVVVIMDACRSGKLAGSSIGGTQATAANLAKQYANEVKILSCQPNEYSIEGEQWGGGRGAFSYNLVNGLYGLADANNDLYVNLKEVNRYLEDRVSAEVAPVPQNPQVIGNPVEVLTQVDAGMLATIRSGKAAQVSMLSAIDSRGMEEDVLAGVDTVIRLKYKRFREALKEKRFLEPMRDCAETYYNELIQEPKLKPLHSAMRRNYAAALQDDAQQVVNNLLKTGLTSEILSNEKASIIYRNYPAYLERAADLLGKEHYMYATLQARRHFFEGKISKEKVAQRQAYHQALQWQPDMPHALVEMVFTFEANQADSAEYYFSKATAQLPSWVVPYTSLAKFYNLTLQDLGKAEALLERAGMVDSASLLVWYQKAHLYELQKKYRQAEYWYLKAISGAGNEICFPCAYNNLGNVYNNMGRHAEADATFEKALQIDSTFAPAYANLGNGYSAKRQYKEAESLLKKAIQHDSTFSYTYNNLGILYYDTRRYEEARTAFKKAAQLDSTEFWFFHNIGNACNQTNRFDEAEAAYKKAIELNPTIVSAYTGLGLTYYNTGRFDETRNAYKKAIQIDSTNANIYNNLGSLYCDEFHSYPEAEAAFKKAIQFDSNFVEAYHNLGNVFLRTSRYQEAEQQFRKALQLYPNAQSYNFLGEVYYNLQRWTDAADVQKKALELDSTLYKPWFDLGIVFMTMHRIRDAEPCFKKVLELNATMPAAYNILGNLCLNENRMAEAESYLKKALQLQPDEIYSMCNLGDLYQKTGRSTEAEEVLNRALSLNPDFYWANDFLGRVYFGRKRYVEAEQLFLKAAQILPTGVEAWTDLTKLYGMQGRIEKAYECLEEVLKMSQHQYADLQEDKELKPLRADKKRWKELMRKYFPDKG